MNLELIQALIPVIVPVLIAGVKYAVPRVPKVALPVLAPLLGAGADILSYYVGLSAGMNPLAGALLGLVGVGVREAYDQAKKALAGA